MIHTLTEKAIAVEVPVGAEDIRVRPINCLNYQLGVIIECPDLPEGNWSILGRPEQMMDIYWVSIIEKENDGSGSLRSWWYRDYSIEGAWTKKISESVLSLLRSKGIDAKNDSVIILIKQQ